MVPIATRSELGENSIDVGVESIRGFASVFVGWRQFKTKL